MNPKIYLQLLLRIVYLTCATMFCFAAGVFGSGLVQMSTLIGSGTGLNPWQAFVPVLIYSLTIAILFAYIIIRSRWFGLKLAIAIFIVMFGLMTVATQLESLLFLGSQIAGGILSRIFLSGFIMAGLFAPLAVIIMGRLKPELDITPNPHLIMPIPEWVWKVVVIGALYVVLYALFGYFVAWKSPAIQEYYGGSDPGNFFVHIANRWQATPHMFFFQFGRGILWMLFALPIIRMHKGVKWEVGLTIALLFAIWSLQLLMPNPFMPPEVAKVHLVEIFSSNFIFGWIVGFLLA